MGKFRINTHGRLHEWIADAKGYFAEAGLTDYEIVPQALPDSTPENPAGAYQTYEEGRDVSVSCACHWTVNMAASNAHGHLWGEAYSVTPSGIFVAPDSGIARLEDLAGVEVDVGYQSGSHYTTIQALETRLSPDQIKLRFGGSPDKRLARLLAGEARAATLFGIQLYIAEQLGYRRIADTTFMVIALVPKGGDPSDVKKYFEALKRAQHDIDLHHQKYTHFFLNEIPERFHDKIDVAAFGPGERFVFEPYSSEMYEATHKWVEERAIFDAEKVGTGAYREAALTLAS